MYLVRTDLLLQQRKEDGIFTWFNGRYKWCITLIYIHLNDQTHILYLLFGDYRPTRKYFTHMETSRLLVKGCKFWPILGTHGHWAVRFFSVPHLLWHGASAYNGHLRGPVTLTYCRALSSGAITTWFCDLGLSRLGFEHSTFRLRGLCSNLLRYRGGLHLRIILLIDGRYIVHVHRYCYKGVIRMKSVNIYGHLLRKCIFSRLILLSIPPFNRNVLCCETIFSKILLVTR